MNTLTNEEFAAKVSELSGPPEGFSPVAYYDPDGDCVEFIARPDDFYAERIDDFVTVYYSEKTGEIIGSLLKRMRFFCDKLSERLPGFKIEIQHGKIKLVHIFRAKLWSSNVDPDGLVTITYRKLIDMTEEQGIEAQMTRPSRLPICGMVSVVFTRLSRVI